MDLFMSSNAGCDVKSTPQKASHSTNMKNKGYNKLGTRFQQSKQKNLNNTSLSVERNRSKSARSTRLKT